MRALSLTQPFATLVAIGAKRVETRNWSTQYRGPLAIHAAKAFPAEMRALCRRPVFQRALALLDPDQLPLGQVIAIGRVADVRSTNSPSFMRTLSPTEIAFGDYRPDRFGWVLSGVRPIPPVAARGMLGLWEWTP